MFSINHICLCFILPFYMLSCCHSIVPHLHTCFTVFMHVFVKLSKAIYFLLSFLINYLMRNDSLIKIKIYSFTLMTQSLLCWEHQATKSSFSLLDQKQFIKMEWKILKGDCSKCQNMWGLRSNKVPNCLWILSFVKRSNFGDILHAVR